MLYKLELNCLYVLVSIYSALSDAGIDTCPGVKELASTVESQQTAIADLRAIVESLQQEVRGLRLMSGNGKRDKRQVETSAFSAYLDHREHTHTGDVLKFNQVIYNLGDGYSTDTGIFTAPIDGAYLFSFQIEDWASQEIRAYLKVDGVNQVDAIINPQGLSSQAGNVAVLGLSMGQKVWVHVDDGQIFGSDGFRGTTFSGAYLMY